MMFRKPFSLLLLASLSACSLTDLAGEPPSLYQLVAPKSASEAAAAASVLEDQLLIDVPMASAGIDSPRVALKQADGTLGYFRDVSWTDRVPVMYQTLLVDAFDNSGRLPAVGRENVGLRADYLLKTDLAGFEADYTGGKPPLVRVALRAKLIVMPRRIIVANQGFAAEVKAEGEEMGQISVAFQQASDQVLRQLVVWTLDEIEARKRQP